MHKVLSLNKHATMKWLTLPPLYSSKERKFLLHCTIGIQGLHNKPPFNGSMLTYHWNNRPSRCRSFTVAKEDPKILVLTPCIFPPMHILNALSFSSPCLQYTVLRWTVSAIPYALLFCIQILDVLVPHIKNTLYSGSTIHSYRCLQHSNSQPDCLPDNDDFNLMSGNIPLALQGDDEGEGMRSSTLIALVGGHVAWEAALPVRCWEIMWGH